MNRKTSKVQPKKKTVKISKGAINFLKNQKEKLGGLFVPNQPVVDHSTMHISSVESLRP